MWRGGLLVVWVAIFGPLVFGCRQTGTPNEANQQNGATIRLPEDALIIHKGSIIDGTGADPIHNGLIAVQGEQIIAVGHSSQFQIPAGAQVISAEGGTILPGFIDAHVHVLENISSMSSLEDWLREGVTSVRDLGSRYGSVDSSSFNITLYKEKLAEFGDSIPSIVIAGPILTASGGYPVTSFSTVALEVADVEEGRQAAQRLLAEGADGLKFAVDGGTPTQPLPVLSSAQVEAITNVAEQENKFASAHALRVQEAQTAVSGGATDLAHMILFGSLSDDLIREMVEREVVIVSTLVVEDNIVATMLLAEEQASLFETQRKDNLARFLAAGGKVALGSDYGNVGIGPGMPIDELIRMNEMGMTPMQVIVAATSAAAQASRIEQQVGTLQIGKQADIIVVQDDPLSDLQAMENVTVVVNNGQLIVRP